MTTQEQYVARLSTMVVQKFGRQIVTLEDCEALGDAVALVTNIKLDGRAFAPLFLDSAKATAPRPVTLSTLTRYLGYSSWGDFCNTTIPVPNDKTDLVSPPRHWGVIILTIVAIIVVITAATLLLRGSSHDTTTHNPDMGIIANEVSERWLARTIEHCNTLRAHNESADYSRRIEAFIDEYSNELYTGIEADIRTTADMRGVDISAADALIYSDSIASSCKAMCRALYSEIESR